MTMPKYTCISIHLIQTILILNSHTKLSYSEFNLLICTYSFAHSKSLVKLCIYAHTYIRTFLFVNNKVVYHNDDNDYYNS